MALLACVSAVGCSVPTFATGIIAGGLCMAAMSGVAVADTISAETIWTTNFSVVTSGTDAGTWSLASEDTQSLTSSAWTLTTADGSPLLSTTAKATELRPNTNVGTNQGWILSFTLSNTSQYAVSISSFSFDSYAWA